MMQRLGIGYQNYPFTKSYYDRRLVQDSPALRTAAHYGFLGQDGFLKPLFTATDTSEFVPALTRFTLYRSEFTLVYGTYQGGVVTDNGEYSAMMAQILGESGIINEGAVVCGIANKSRMLQYIWEPQSGVPTAVYKGGLYLAYWGNLILEQPHKLQYGNFAYTGEGYLELPCSRYIFNGRHLTEEEVVAEHLDKTVYVVADAEGALVAYIY